MKGTMNEYWVVHQWVNRQLGKPQECENCGDGYDKRFQWANISGQYKRDISDWARLCYICHLLFDNRYLKTVCRNGHKLTDDNLYIYSNPTRRECMTCRKLRHKVSNAETNKRRIRV